MFRGRICCETLCDIQRTLPFAGPAKIREEAERLLAQWAMPAGGLILADYGDPVATGVPLEKKRIMLDAFLALDPWRRSSTSQPAI
jgi:hypothetical protein